MGRKNRAHVTDAQPSADYVPPRITLDPPPAREIAENMGRAHLSRTARAKVDADDAAAMIGHDGTPLDPDLLGRLRDAREIHGALAVANAALFLDFPDWETGDAVHRAVGLRAPDGQYRVDVPVHEAQVLLLWGDETITTFRDDDRYGNIGEHASRLRQRMMVLRLRYLADLIEHGGPDVDHDPHADRA